MFNVFKDRRIIVKGTKDTIELVCSYSKHKSFCNYELLINGVSHEKFSASPFNTKKHGFNYELNGILNSDINVTATIKTYLFKRTEYAIYVDNQEVHKEKGAHIGL